MPDAPNSNKTALIMAGGTGGHIFPALAVAQTLHAQGWGVAWLGSARGMEARIVPQNGFVLHSLDFSGVPDEQAGPVNSPLPTTISASRVAITMLAGYGEAPNEGHFRPLKVITRPGSMFDPLPPAPSFIYGWSALQAIEVIYNAVSHAMPKAVPACSGGCICAIVAWGQREKTRAPWADGTPLPTGQGAWNGGDGGTMLHIAESATRFTPTEVWEQRNPWLVKQLALAQDSAGPGKWRGGPGVDLDIQMLEDTLLTSVVERSLNPPWGLMGGGQARANKGLATMPSGESAIASPNPLASASSLISVALL